ncbi:MAG: hypothetical protein AB7S36_09045 [Planctomycetota bacterium]
MSQQPQSQPQKPRLLILGAGSEAAWVIEILAATGNPYEIIGLVDLTERGKLKGTRMEGYEVLGTVEELLTIADRGVDYYIAASRDNRARADATRRAEVCGIYPVKIFHPRATVATSSRIEPGSILHPGCVLGPRAVVRAGSVIDTRASIDGFSTVGPFAHLDVGCHIAGRCDIGPYVTVGAGSIVLPRVRVGQGAIVAPGTVVTRPVDDFCVVSGSPARVIDRLERPRDSATSMYEQSSGTREIPKAPPDSSPDVRAESGAREGDDELPDARPLDDVAEADS